MIVFTQEYLVAAPHATIEITYPDGAVWRTRALADGNGSFTASIRDAIDIGWEGRGSKVVECSRNLDRLRKSHADAAAREPGRASSQWAVSPRIVSMGGVPVTRWFPEGEAELRAEQEPAFMHRERPRAVLLENPLISGAWQCVDCGGNGRCECQSVDELRKVGGL